mmetsp:Transcript_15517/g.38446  ORF Transcript_15517/g.38446 Transcript_15517/m.38446 type:complete len:333 (+) Transcript_15517:147-1145(+)
MMMRSFLDAVLPDERHVRPARSTSASTGATTTTSRHLHSAPPCEDIVKNPSCSSSSSSRRSSTSFLVSATRAPGPHLHGELSKIETCSNSAPSPGRRQPPDPNCLSLPYSSPMKKKFLISPMNKSRITSFSRVPDPVTDPGYITEVSCPDMRESTAQEFWRPLKEDSAVLKAKMRVKRMTPSVLDVLLSTASGLGAGFSACMGLRMCVLARRRKKIEKKFLKDNEIKEKSLVVKEVVVGEGGEAEQDSGDEASTSSEDDGQEGQEERRGGGEGKKKKGKGKKGKGKKGKKKGKSPASGGEDSPASGGGGGGPNKSPGKGKGKGKGKKKKKSS